MEKFTIKPVLGRKNDVPADDRTMFKILNQEGTEAAVHEADGLNTSYNRQRGAVSKSYGYTDFSNAATTTLSGITASGTVGLHELDDGINRDNLIFDNGNVFYYDSNANPVQINNAYIGYTGRSGDFTHNTTITGTNSAASATIVYDDASGAAGTLYFQTVTGTFENGEAITDTGGATATTTQTLQTTTYSTDKTNLYSIDTYGSYCIFSDYATNTPQKWANGDQRVTRLITKDDATTYKFRYLIEFHGRIIGAYSTETNGDLEIRWTTSLPNVTTLEFAAADQLYTPGSDSITGISKMGANALYVYTLNNIYEVSYYPDATIVFGFAQKVAGQGCASHHSIVNAMGLNFFFNKNLGFVAYEGGDVLNRDHIISREIEDYVQSIDLDYADQIIGKYIPYDDKIIWSVPGSTSTVDLLVYDLQEGTWCIQRKGTNIRYIDAWTTDSSDAKRLVFSKLTGEVEQGTGEVAGGESTFTNYWISPMLDFARKDNMKLLLEIWLGIHSGGAYNLNVYWRGGDTVKETEAASWTTLDTISLNNPDSAVIYLAQTAKLHQLKFGNTANSQPYSINNITLYYILEEKY